jgi:hypothetical protein
MSYLYRMFSTQELGKPGGRIFRTIASLPKHISVQMIISMARHRGHRYRRAYGRIFIYA